MASCVAPFITQATKALQGFQTTSDVKEKLKDKSLSDHVALVTGATRGVGKGIALQLGEAGCTVYITGRTIYNSGEEPGSLQDTAREVELRGGRCITVPCDHSRDDDVEILFQQIKKEQSGRLDILVNNAYSASQMVDMYIGTSFWETPSSMWDEVTRVGLRNHYMCTVQAAKLMVPRKSGLIINISSAGGMRYLFNIPYGIGKEGLDRMAADCALELYRYNVAMISLWPGAVQTDQAMKMVEQKTMNRRVKNGRRMYDAFKQGETIEYAGKGVVKLALDKNIMQKSGKIWLTTDLGSEYKFYDLKGNQPYSMRSLKNSLLMDGHGLLAGFVPQSLNIPKWVFSISSSKFAR